MFAHTSRVLPSCCPLPRLMANLCFRKYTPPTGDALHENSDYNPSLGQKEVACVRAGNEAHPRPSLPRNTSHPVPNQQQTLAKR